jgi:hypothetical protein
LRNGGVFPRGSVELKDPVSRFYRFHGPFFEDTCRFKVATSCRVSVGFDIPDSIMPTRIAAMPLKRWRHFIVSAGFL